MYITLVVALLHSDILLRYLAENYFSGNYEPLVTCAIVSSHEILSNAPLGSKIDRVVANPASVNVTQPLARKKQSIQ